MPRYHWFEDGTEVPLIDEQVRKLDHFVEAMSDGMIEKSELEKQQSILVNAMKDVEGDLNDQQHAKVTRLLAELSAYNVMRVLHDLRQARLEKVFQSSS